MLKRALKSECSQLLKEYPIVTLLGPRQAGKTTLARTFRQYAYCNLELPENRELAETDPKALLGRYPGKTIFDEIQRVPGLLSYLQVMVDEERRNGRFILTGSHQLALKESIAQSLAGRTALLHLLPFSIAELTAGGIHFDSFMEYVFTGFLPRIHDEGQRPRQAYANYYQTYVERDVRQLVNLKDASLFEKFMKLLAGRVGQLMDHTALGNAVGVDAKTIRHWLSILEASFIIFKLPPYYENFGKRTLKAPKYYFVEPGLLVYLLGIDKPDQVARDPLVGSIFENLVVLECLKAQYNNGNMSNLYFFRDSNGNEVDVLFRRGSGLVAIEIKSAATYKDSHFNAIRNFSKSISDPLAAYLVFNGDDLRLSNGFRALRFDRVAEIFK